MTNFFYALLFFICYQATNPYLYAQNKGSFSFVPPQKKKVSLSFKGVNNLIVLPLRINNSDTMQFILDTGAPKSIITSLFLTDSVSINYTRKVKVRGVGKGNSIEALYSEGNSVFFDKIRGKNIDFLILMEDIFHLSKRLGISVNGIIGYDLFKEFIVEINYDRHYITFHNPLYYRYKKGKKYTQEFPLEIINTKPYIQVEAQMYDGKKRNLKLIIDSGGGHSLILDHTDSLPSHFVDAILGQGLVGDIEGKLGRIQSITLGKIKIESPTASFPTASSELDVTTIDGRNGSLGGDILRRFHVIIDYPNKKITLTPNSMFKQKYNYNMSGLEVSNIILGFPLYQIVNVRKGSPAEKAGIEVGDKILSINGKSISEYKINDIYQLMISREGRKIRMELDRNGFKKRVEFILQKAV